MARDVRSWNQGGLGVFTLPNFIRPDGSTEDLITKIIGIGMTIVIGFVLTWFFYKEPDAEALATASKHVNLKTSKITSPIKGEVMTLSSIEDEAFASGLLGKGVAISPSEGKVVAPEDGILTTLFPTNHAIGMTTDEGVELLIHVGMDTVQLEGQHFVPKAKQGERIKKGQVLVEFDMAAIQRKGFSLITPIIVTNSKTFTDVVETQERSAAFGKTLLHVIK